MADPPTEGGPDDAADPVVEEVAEAEAPAEAPLEAEPDDAPLEAEADDTDDGPPGLVGRRRGFIDRPPGEVAGFLERARTALKAEGFIETPFQYRKKSQVFGLIKDHGHDLQLHVRAFADGVIESEVELSNRYVEHLVSPRRSAHAEIKAVFEKHGLETETINEEFQTRTGSTRTRMPRTRTKTTDIMKGIGVAGALGAVAIARFVQKRKKR